MTEYQKAMYELGKSEAKFYRSIDEWVLLSDDSDLWYDSDFIFFEAGFDGDNVRQVYAVRFGEIPENGKSYNWCDKSYEKGVSCVKIVNGIDDNCHSIYDVTLGWQGIKKYLVKGDYMGLYGSDGEPLLHNVEIVKEID